MRTIRHPYKGDHYRVSVDEFDESRTKQSFKKECDINQIMRKFQKTGAITHLAKYGARYGDASSTDLLEAMNTVIEAQRMYDDLPSSLRKKFGSPAAFIEFIEDPDNKEELYELGLAIRPVVPDPILVKVLDEKPLDEDDGET